MTPPSVRGSFGSDSVASTRSTHRIYGPDFKRFLPIQIDGRARLDVEGMTRRMEDVLERTLRRL